MLITEPQRIRETTCSFSNSILRALAIRKNRYQKTLWPLQTGTQPVPISTPANQGGFIVHSFSTVAWFTGVINDALEGTREDLQLSFQFPVAPDPNDNFHFARLSKILYSTEFVTSFLTTAFSFHVLLLPMITLVQIAPTDPIGNSMPPYPVERD